MWLASFFYVLLIWCFSSKRGLFSSMFSRIAISICRNTNHVDLPWNILLIFLTISYVVEHNKFAAREVLTFWHKCVIRIFFSATSSSISKCGYNGSINLMTDLKSSESFFFWKNPCKLFFQFLLSMACWTFRTFFTKSNALCDVKHNICSIHVASGLNSVLLHW